MFSRVLKREVKKKQSVNYKLKSMVADKSDKQNAVNIHASIGSQILAASLVLIGILLGYFSLKNLELSSIGGILIIIGVILLLISFIAGGIGLSILRENGNNGVWDYSKTHLHFRIQTWLNYLVIVLFSIILFLPSAKSDELKELEKNNVLLEKSYKLDSINSLNKVRQDLLIQIIQKEVNFIKNKIDSLEKKTAFYRNDRQKY
jgi:hypothetical protein